MRTITTFDRAGGRLATEHTRKSVKSPRAQRTLRSYSKWPFRFRLSISDVCTSHLPGWTLFWPATSPSACIRHWGRRRSSLIIYSVILYFIFFCELFLASSHVVYIVRVRLDMAVLLKSSLSLLSRDPRWMRISMLNIEWLFEGSSTTRKFCVSFSLRYTHFS